MRKQTYKMRNGNMIYYFLMICSELSDKNVELQYKNKWPAEMMSTV